MRTVKLTIAYDGTAYAGWQVQRGRPSVQGTLEAALQRVTGQAASVLASGRTDAGVHALGQVVGFRTSSRLPVDVLRRALNAVLPRDIAVLEAAEAPEGFHPTHHAVRKQYRYVIHDGPVRDVFQRHYCWHYTHGRLDAQSMHRAAQALLGTHDFSSFETRGAERKSPVRTVFELSVRRGRGDCPDFRVNENGTVPFDAGAGQGGAAPEAGARRGSQDLILVEIEADGFLYNMVRAIVGTLVEVGRGAHGEAWPGEVLRAADRRRAGPTAPPQGLFLVRVEYGDCPDFCG